MKLNNGIIELTLTNKGGEMSSLLFKGKEILYKGDGPYWTGKNPTLFPMISSPNSKQYTFEGKTYPCRNHGVIRYAELETTSLEPSKITMRLLANKETLKEYPFNFDYQITYRLDNNKVLINYKIKNLSDTTMPFTFGLHPGFLVDDIKNVTFIFPDDEKGILIPSTTREKFEVNLGEYHDFYDNYNKYGEAVIYPHLNSKYITLRNHDYDVNVDISNARYVALWTANKEANFVCIEPWLSINAIKNATNPFDPSFELEYLKPQETFEYNYSIEVVER